MVFQKGKIVVEAKNESLLNDILADVIQHFNKKQDNFKLETTGFKIDTDN